MKPTIINGWDIPKEEYLKAYQDGKLVKLCIDLSNVCTLSCPGCFTKRVGDSFTDKGKKRLPNEMPYESQFELIEEASNLGAKTVDIVGAGEPTSDPRFNDIIGKINDLGMRAVIFTHGATREFDSLESLVKKDISFFVKLWSLNNNLQNLYVAGSLPDYALKRDIAINKLISLKLNEGIEKKVDGIDYKSSRVGADVLVMRSNYAEIPDILRFCRDRNIMPITKTYIPEGPTLFAQEMNKGVITPIQLSTLKKDEVSPQDFQRLREKLVKIDSEEYEIKELNTMYPQACKCTQSMAALYVTITGDIRSCVGTHFSYVIYQPGKNMLKEVLIYRKERVGFGCAPRIEDAERRNLKVDDKLLKIYSSGIS